MANIAVLRGLVAYWRGLKAIGRWGNPEHQLLEAVSGDLFETATGHYRRALAIFEPALENDHPDTLHVLHLLQELPYSLGRFSESLPWCLPQISAGQTRLSA